MVYIAGFIGFIGGFALGLFLLGLMLKERTKRELLNDGSLKWRYGLFNWLIAGLGAYCAVLLYRLYFPAF